MNNNKNKINFVSILNQYGLSKTPFRINLLKIFHESKKSLSIDEILNFTNQSINKVTVYRALESFEKKGLIHQVPDKNNLKRYSLCTNQCSINEHNHKHGHFICDNCNETFCLDDMPNPDFSFLKGFYIKQLNLTLEGLCQKCNNY